VPAFRDVQVFNGGKNGVEFWRAIHLRFFIHPAPEFCIIARSFSHEN
jgi:hypothetical protein